MYQKSGRSGRKIDLKRKIRRGRHPWDERRLPMSPSPGSPKRTRKKRHKPKGKRK